MEISKILAGIKGKVLDAANFELLQSAYELQENNLSQLKQNNEAITESQGLLKEKSAQLEKENESLRAKVAELEAQLAAANPDGDNGGLSKAAISILQMLIENDSTRFIGERVSGITGLTNIESAAAIDELEENGLARATAGTYEGVEYSLTDSGKRYVLKMQSA